MSVDVIGVATAGGSALTGVQTGSTVKALNPINEIRALDEAIENARMRYVAPPSPVQVAELINPAIANDAAIQASTSGEAIPPSTAAGPQQSNPGDTILSGLGRVKSVFSKKEADLAETMQSTNMSVGSMMKLQMEMVQYSVLIDVASKITGKFTQTVDSLVKGQ